MNFRMMTIEHDVYDEATVALGDYKVVGASYEGGYWKLLLAGEPETARRPVARAPDVFPPDTEWHIKSGTLDCVDSGATPMEAFVKAVRVHRPDSLGHIFTALRVGETDMGEERLAAVGQTLAEAGLYGGNLDTPRPSSPPRVTQIAGPITPFVWPSPDDPNVTRYEARPALTCPCWDGNHKRCPACKALGEDCPCGKR